MYADRYGPRPINPGSLTLSISIVGGLLAAVMLSPTVIEHVSHDKEFRIFKVPPTPPPPPEVHPTIKPKVEPRATRITPPITIVPRPPENWTVPPPDPGPIPDLGTSEGLGTGEAVVDPPKPAPLPVLTGARPDPRVDFQPTYPAEERRAGNEGVVTLRVLVGVDGRVRQVERIAAASDAFWRVTERRALGAWRFTPATRDGIPYESWRTMTVRFRLEVE